MRILFLCLALLGCKSEEQQRCERNNGDWESYNCLMIPSTHVIMAGKTPVVVTDWIRICDHHCVFEVSADQGWR